MHAYVLSSWSLAYGLVLLTLSACSLIMGRIYALIMMKLAFRLVASKVEELNDLHRNDKITWQLVYKAYKQVIGFLSVDRLSRYSSWH